MKTKTHYGGEGTGKRLPACGRWNGPRMTNDWKKVTCYMCLKQRPVPEEGEVIDIADLEPIYAIAGDPSTQIIGQRKKQL